MKKRIDYLLLEILWVLAVTLGLGFWMTTRYAFNIFSGAHWKYLAELQARAVPVRGGFYTSLIIGIIIMFGGMFLLVRPQLRKIKFPKIRLPHRAHVAKTKSDPAPTPVVTSSAPVATAAPAMKRPPRPYVGVATGTATANTAPATPVVAPATPAAPTTPAPREYPEIRRIFESTGYTVKSVSSINGFAPALFAIGANEVLWLGGVDVSTHDVRNAITALQKVFSETLDDIEINVNGFAVNAPDATTSEFQDILMFPDADALREYMTAHKNDMSNEDSENFAAYSEYIDTVINYIAKK